jgi:hypothetical protein
MRILITVLMFCTVAAAQLPDAPQPQPKATQRVTFWTFQPDRPWTATLKSPWYWGAEGLADGMTIWDWKRHNCKGNNPCSNQFWSERGAAMIAVGLLQWPLDAKVSRPVGLVPVGVLLGRSVYSLATGRYQ